MRLVQSISYLGHIKLLEHGSCHRGAKSCGPVLAHHNQPPTLYNVMLTFIHIKNIVNSIICLVCNWNVGYLSSDIAFKNSKFYFHFDGIWDFDGIAFKSCPRFLE